MVCGAVFTPAILDFCKRKKLYDLPNSRKVHAMAVPRMGGISFFPSMVLGFAVCLIVIASNDGIDHPLTIWSASYLVGLAIIYVTGIVDDMIGLNASTKFMAQICAASLLPLSGLYINDLYGLFGIYTIPAYIGVPLTVFMIVFVINAINLIDGIDGLASGLAIIALTVIATLNIYLGHLAWAMIATAMLGVLCAFFYFNVFGKRDKTFMGDAGSLTLGYTLAFLILHFWQRDPVWNKYIHNVGIIALSTLIIPMFDVVRVMMSRLRDKRDPFLPDKNHIHHKLLRTGMSPTWVMITLLCLSSAFIFINYLTAAYLSQTLMIIFDILGFCLMHIIINLFIWRKEKATGIEWDRIMQSTPQQP